MIVVAGEALVDLVIDPDGTVTAKLGGAPFNTARAIARLGLAVEFVGALSDDRFGTLLLEQLRSDGVGVAHVPRPALPTTLAAAELDESGGARYRFYIESTSAPQLRPADVATVPTDPAVFFAGGLGLVFEPMADTVVELVEGVGVTTAVFIDVNCRPNVIDDRDRYLARLDRVLARADVVKVSDEDVRYLFPGATSADGAAELLRRGPAAVVVTAGSTSTSVVTSDGSRDVPVQQLDGPVVDTIGAGDTFVGGLLSAWARRDGGRASLRGGDVLDTLVPAVQAAHHVAAVVVTRRGADPPWRHELPESWAT